MKMAWMSGLMMLAMTCHATQETINFDDLDWGALPPMATIKPYTPPPAPVVASRLPLIIFCIIVWHAYAEEQDLPFSLAISFDV